MSRSRTSRFTPLAAAALLGVLWVSPGTAPAAAQPAEMMGGCVSTVICTTGRCLKVPTSLPAVGGAADPRGWKSAGGNCGTRRCCLIFRCPCGPSLAFAACI